MATCKRQPNPCAHSHFDAFLVDAEVGVVVYKTNAANIKMRAHGSNDRPPLQESDVFTIFTPAQSRVIICVSAQGHQSLRGLIGTLGLLPAAA
jgi:hypothetical protein